MRWQYTAVLGFVGAFTTWMLVGSAPDQVAPNGHSESSGSSARAASAAAAEPTTPAQPAGWGTVKGRIVLGDDEIPERVLVVKKGAANVNNPERCAARDLLSEELIVNKDNRGLKWVIVSLNKPSATHPDLGKVEGEVEFGQEFCVFKPHLLAFRQGQKLKITSNDPIGHNTNLTPFQNAPWNQSLPGAPEAGKTEMDGPALKAEPRPIPVACNIHGHMKAYIVVFDHPYFAVTDENGAFELKKVPAGEQRLVVWQEKCGYGSGRREGQAIEVKADETTDLGKIELKLPKQSP